MTSKLWHTLVGVGIALGGAGPGCFGQTAADEAGADEAAANDDLADAQAADGGEADAETLPVSDAGIGDATRDDSALADAMSAAFCDVAWPPTKANPDPNVPRCVDPSGECVDAMLPDRCFALLAPNTCDYDQQFQDPIYCVDGEWQCPPGSTSGWTCEGDECHNECECWGPLPEGEACGSGADTSGAAGASSSEAG